MTRTERRWRDVVRADPCVYCNGVANTIEHVTPKSHGGTYEASNIVGACGCCNRDRGNDSVLAFLVRRRRDGVPPTWRWYQAHVEPPARVRRQREYQARLRAAARRESAIRAELEQREWDAWWAR